MVLWSPWATLSLTHQSGKKLTFLPSFLVFPLFCFFVCLFAFFSNCFCLHSMVFSSPLVSRCIKRITNDQNKTVKGGNYIRKFLRNHSHNFYQNKTKTKTHTQKSSVAAFCTYSILNGNNFLFITSHVHTGNYQTAHIPGGRMWLSLMWDKSCSNKQKSHQLDEPKSSGQGITKKKMNNQ